nr:hypothetical protein EP46_17575 [Pantoea sp. 3.5.1]
MAARVRLISRIMVNGRAAAAPDEHILTGLCRCAAIYPARHGAEAGRSRQGRRALPFHFPYGLKDATR